MITPFMQGGSWTKYRSRDNVSISSVADVNDLFKLDCMHLIEYIITVKENRLSPCRTCQT